MAKTPEEVTAKLQRRLENTGRHITGLIDSLEGSKKMTRRLEDTLAYAWRQLDALRDDEVAVKNAVEAIEHAIPTRIRSEQEKQA